MTKLYVGRYDNTSGYMEWGDVPTSDYDAAVKSVEDCHFSGEARDVVEVTGHPGAWVEGRQAGVWGQCVYCKLQEMQRITQIVIHGETHEMNGHECSQCGAV